ncbi:iron reductase [Coniophora puteana RWD-64-598 SS2]|uniref:ferric-chelate reductase (NADPH) n=1 Tax=Coniophora puteana (strain RWD-64-598) TaxID=741705 RepID=A0A5M3MA02_CONPW|nr:iron reductase [Coniophora puteana RWD-64-598 SS2]EIW76078.1 iron reductase [Coniophora puteana RWD-64-598 SS2]
MGMQETNPMDTVIRDERDNAYPLELWWSISIVMGVVGAFNWGSYVHSRLNRLRGASPADAENGASPSRKVSSWRRVPVAAVNAFRVVSFRWTLNVGSWCSLSLAEFFIGAGYIAMLITFAFINTTNLESQKFDVHYWAHRCGHLAACQVPFLAALGAKNNLVSLVTGVSYERLNFVHRVLARGVLMLLLIHAGGETHVHVNAGLFPIYIQEAWLRLGITAVSSLFLLFLISLRPIRSRFYEFFFFSHLVLAFIFIIGAYFHTKAQVGDFWLWPAFVFWGLDRLIRFVRLVVFNHSYFGLKTGTGTMDASTELMADNLVRIRMKRPPHFHWSAGQTAFLIMPAVSTLPFEAHPFTIASIDSSLFAPEQFGEEDASVAPLWKELVFLVNVHGGFTKRLKETATAKGEVKVFVDGPYGPSPELGCYNTCILVAGGSGVSYTLPVLLNIIEAARNNVSQCTRVLFFWSVRDASHIFWIEQALVKAIQLAPPSLSISIRIHVTGSTSQPLGPSPDGSLEKVTGDDASERTSKGKSSFLTLSAVRVENGRADINELLNEEVASASGRMSVSVCGSQSISRAVRSSLCLSPSGVLSGGPSIVLHVESFGYA